MGIDVLVEPNSEMPHPTVFLQGPVMHDSPHSLVDHNDDTLH